MAPPTSATSQPSIHPGHAAAQPPTSPSSLPALAPTAPPTGYPPYAPAQRPAPGMDAPKGLAPLQQGGAPEPHDGSKTQASVAFDLALGPTFPLGIGPQANLEIPGRIQLRFDLAWVPAAFADTIVGIAGSESLIAEMTREALSDAVVLRGSVGWRPFPDHGFEIGGGYTAMFLGAQADSEAVAAVLGGELKKSIDTDLIDSMSMDALIHSLHVGVGWRWLALDDHMVIRASLGYVQAVGSSSSLRVAESASLQQKIEPTFQERLNDIVTSDVKLPLLGLTVGYRF